MMSKSSLATAAVCLTLAACAPMTPSSTQSSTKPTDTAAAGGSELAGAWFSPPAEYPGICMTLAPGGQVKFAGGFAFFNPGHWRYDSAASELRIELGGDTPIPPALPKAEAHGAAAPQRVEQGKRTLVYSMTPSTEAVDVGGFVFYRKLACP